jgi:hypothetical protein
VAVLCKSDEPKAAYQEYHIRQLEDERLFEANHRLLKEISKKK